MPVIQSFPTQHGGEKEEISDVDVSSKCREVLYVVRALKGNAVKNMLG